jgi:hypothetical protein
MSRPAYPTPAEFVAAFADSGLSDVLPVDIGDALVIAQVNWETETDWGPYLSTGIAFERSFDAPGPIRPVRGLGRVGGGTRLALKSGLLSFESLSINGIEMTLGRDFFLEPANALSEGLPVTAIRFTRPIYSVQQGVKVKGTWGAVTELPDDVWRAVLLRAAWEERASIGRKWKALTASAQESIIKAKSSGPVRIEYAAISGDKLLSLDDTFNAWQETWQRALRGRVFTQP